MCPDSTSPHMVLMFNGTITVCPQIACLAGRRRRARARALKGVLRAGVHLGKGIPWFLRVEVSPHQVPRLPLVLTHGAHVQWDHHCALRLLASPVGGGARARALSKGAAGWGALGVHTWGKVFHCPLGLRSLFTMCPDSTSPHMVLMFNGTLTVPSDCLFNWR